MACGDKNRIQFVRTLSCNEKWLKKQIKYRTKIWKKKTRYCDADKPMKWWVLQEDGVAIAQDSSSWDAHSFSSGGHLLADDLDNKNLGK